MSTLNGAELDAVAAVLRAHGVALDAGLGAEQIAGGRSNLTFLLTDGARRWVLRTPPRTGRTPSAHDVAREFRVTRALGGTDVPVPPAVALCEDESLIGGPFAVWEFVSGRSVQTQAELDTLDPAMIDGIADSLIATLAALHRVDHDRVGLAEFGRPDGYSARQLKRWSGQWQIVGIPEWDAAATELSARLAERIPTQRCTGIVHGDFRIDNTLLDRTGRVTAVLDWELSTIGDPVADLAMMCAYRHPAFDLIVGEPSAWTSSRLPTADDLARRYAAATGADLTEWPAHLALACFKIAVIAAGIDHRRRSGSGSGPGFDTAGQCVGSYLELGLQALEDS